MSVMTQVSGSAVPVTTPGQRALLVNTSLSETMWLDTFQQPTAASTVLTPQSSIIVTGQDGEQWFARTASGEQADISSTPNIAAFNQATPPLQTASLRMQGAGTYALITFPAAGRIWNAQVSAALISESTFTGGFLIGGAQINSAEMNLVLTSVDVAIAGSSQLCVSNTGIPLGGIPVAEGDMFSLEIASTGDDPADTYITATGILGYSIP